MPYTQTHVDVDASTHKITGFKNISSIVRVSLGCGMTVDAAAEDLASNPRWKTLVGNHADCSACSNVENGIDPVSADAGFNPPAGQ